MVVQTIIIHILTIPPQSLPGPLVWVAGRYDDSWQQRRKGCTSTSVASTSTSDRTRARARAP